MSRDLIEDLAASSPAKLQMNFDKCSVRCKTCKMMSPVDKMGAETAVDTFRGEFSLLGAVVGPGAPIAHNL